MNYKKPRLGILNDLLSIGGICTKNNLYSPKAKTHPGEYLQINIYFREWLKDGLIKKLDTITKARNKNQETFYCLTSKGADYIGRRDEYQPRTPKSPNNVKHESIKFDVALAFLRNFRDWDINIRYDEIFNGIKPDIVVRMEHRETGEKRDYLVEIENKKTIDQVYRKKILRYDEHFKTYKPPISPKFKVLVVYCDLYFDAFLRPVQYDNPKSLLLMEKRVKKLALISSERYLFLPVHKFEKLEGWTNSKGEMINLL